MHRMKRARPGLSDAGHRVLIAIVLLVAAAATSQAAPQRTPNADWPCPQIKVPEVSLAAIWTGPDIGSAQSGWTNDPSVAALVQQIAPRRLPVEQAQTLIRAFARDAGDLRKTKLLDLLVGLFTTLGQERAAVIAGLDRFGRRQKELAARIRAENEKLRALQSDQAADPSAVAQAAQQVTWDVEVFQDCRQAISAACAVPGKIEQRLFTLAHTIQDEIE
jgi:hypothetical protein